MIADISRILPGLSVFVHAVMITVIIIIIIIIIIREETDM
jgi:hypothetical protein